MREIEFASRAMYTVQVFSKAVVQNKKEKVFNQNKYLTVPILNSSVFAQLL